VRSGEPSGCRSWLCHKSKAFPVSHIWTSHSGAAPADAGDIDGRGADPWIGRPGNQSGALRRTLAVAAAAVLLPLLTLAGCAPAVSRRGPVELEHDRAALDRFLADERDAAGLPGMAVAVVRGRDVVYVQGFGSDGRKRPVDGSTQFMLASLSKAFTAVAVLQLVRAGRINLDAPVRDYLPEFTTADPSASRQITVRHLLNHTSGLADVGFRAGLSAQPRDLEQRVQDLRAAWPVSTPGREFHYLEPNYQLLARLVEVTTGQEFDHYLAGQVFAPLGMTARWPWTPPPRREAAHRDWLRVTSWCSGSRLLVVNWMGC